MVLTRRAAKAAAEAEAVRPSTTSSSPISATKPKSIENVEGEESSTANTSEQKQDQVQSSSSPIKPNSSATGENDPLFSKQKDQAELDRNKTQLSSVVNSYLLFGHFVACVAVLVAAHASTFPPTQSQTLRIHAIILLICIIPLRSIFSFKSKIPIFQQKKGISLALSAPFVFASNALHLLASRFDSSSNLLLYIGASAAQVASAWLDMTVAFTAPSPSPSKLLFIRSVLDSCADLYLAATIANVTPVMNSLRATFYIRIFIDIVRILISFSRILSHDKSEKNQKSASESTS